MLKPKIKIPGISQGSIHSPDIFNSKQESPRIRCQVPCWKTNMTVPLADLVPIVPVSCIQCPVPAASQPLVWDWGPGQGEGPPPGPHGQEAPSTWHIFSFYGVSSAYPWLLAQLKRWPKHLFHVCYYLPYFLQTEVKPGAALHTPSW